MIGRYEVGDEAWIEITASGTGYNIKWSHIEGRDHYTAGQAKETVEAVLNFGYKLSEASVVENLLREYDG